MSLLSRSNVSSCSLLPLRVGKPLYTNSLIAPRARGVRFFVARFCSPPPELHETGTIRKHWNRATKYAKTRRVHKLGSGIYALVCGLKNCSNVFSFQLGIIADSTKKTTHMPVLTLHMPFILHKKVRQRCWRLKNHPSLL